MQIVGAFKCREETRTVLPTYLVGKAARSLFWLALDLLIYLCWLISCLDSDSVKIRSHKRTSFKLDD